jgi:hypothetical protein
VLCTLICCLFIGMLTCWPCLCICVYVSMCRVSPAGGELIGAILYTTGKPFNDKLVPQVIKHRDSPLRVGFPKAQKSKEHS